MYDMHVRRVFFVVVSWLVFFIGTFGGIAGADAPSEVELGCLNTAASSGNQGCPCGLVWPWLWVLIRLVSPS